jgi:hypothetical protein
MTSLRARLLLALITLSTLSANLWILLKNPLNNDVAWYLYMASGILSGKRLYVDFIETNPPLMCMLTIFPVWIAKVSHVDPKLMWYLTTTLVCGAFAAAAAWFWGIAQTTERTVRAVLFAFLLVISLAFFFAYDFGQRDHLAFVASLAVCGLLAARLASANVSKSATIATAVFGGLFLALKPFFVLPWLLCLIWAITAKGWKSAARWPETYIVPAMSLVQVVLVLFVTPAYFAVMRLVASLYSSFGTESWRMLLTRPFLLVSLVGSSLTFLYSASAARRNSIRLASLHALGWFLSGFLQRKGWHYHTLPAVVALCFAVWMILLDVASARTVRSPSRRVVLATAAVLLFGFAGVRTLRLRWGYPSDNENLIPILMREARGAPVAALATGMSVFPLINDTGTTLGLHYNGLWPLPGLYARQVQEGTPDGVWHYRQPSEMGAAEREMFDSVVADLAAEPRLIILWRGKTEQGMGTLRVDLLGYFSQDTRVMSALSHYEPVSVPGDYVVLRHLPESASVR